MRKWVGKETKLKFISPMGQVSISNSHCSTIFLFVTLGNASLWASRPTDSRTTIRESPAAFLSSDDYPWWGVTWGKQQQWTFASVSHMGSSSGNTRGWEYSVKMPLPLRRFSKAIKVFNSTKEKPHDRLTSFLETEVKRYLLLHYPFKKKKKSREKQTLMGNCMCVSINAPSIETRCISYVSLFLIYCILQVSLVFLFKYSFLILKVLVPYPDFSAVHSGYTSKLQVYNWRYGRSRVFGAREAAWRRETVLFLRCWFHCDFGQPLAQQEEACPHIRDSGQRLLLCGGKRHGFVWAGKASDQWAVMLLWSHLSLYAEKGWQQAEYLQMQVFCALPCLCRFPFSFQWEALFAFIKFSSIIISPL